MFACLFVVVAAAADVFNGQEEDESTSTIEQLRTEATQDRTQENQWGFFFSRTRGEMGVGGGGGALILLSKGGGGF